MSDHQEIWCQPSDQPKRQFLVLFDDPQMDIAVFDDEAEARKYWEEATINWSCYLLGTLHRSAARSDQMATALDLYRMAAHTDVTMEGVHFLGVNRAAFKRAWDADRADIERLDRADAIADLLKREG